MFLSILIPTYNRSKYLKKNLDLLNLYIVKMNLFDQIEIIISNNNSSDDTEVMVNEFIKNQSNLNLNYFTQYENIGLEKNALFVLKEAIGDFVMFLGDDDYLDKNYLIGVVRHLKKNINTHTIIPNFVPVDIFGMQTGPGRDDRLQNQVFQSGFNNCLINSWRGHQLSGLVLKRKGLYEAYNDLNISNIYLFIFFLAYSCLNGDSYHFTEYPVKVTQPGQANKDWGYGKDGLLNEVFDNYLKLHINYFQKSFLQLFFLIKQPWRLSMYEKKSFRIWFEAFQNILVSSNSTLLFKTLFPFVVVFLSIKRVVKRVL